MFVTQAQEQLQADVLRYKAKIEDLEKELTLKGQVGHSCIPIHTSNKATAFVQHYSNTRSFQVLYGDKEIH